MADHRSKSHRAPDRTGLTWVTWAEKYAPQTTTSSSTSERAPKICDGIMRIRHQDIGLYGLCPRHDECCLVVCNQCKQSIRFQALYGHYERRHSHHLTSSRNHHSTNHKETCKNSNTNGPYALPEKPPCIIPDRRDSSSGSSDRIRRNSAKETAVTSSSKRKLSLSSQWDSDSSSSSESRDGDSDSAGRRRAGSHRSGDLTAKLRSSNASVHCSETSRKSSAKKSVQVNGVKVASATQPTSVGAGKSQHATPVVVSTNRSSSKHITSSSQATPESRLSVERPSKSHATRTEPKSDASKSDASKSESTLPSRTSERCDSSSKSYYPENYSKKSIACKPRDSRDRSDCAATSLRSSRSSCDSSHAASARESSLKNSKSSETSTLNLEGSRSRSKHRGVPESKSISTHPPSLPSASTLTSLPAASRSSSIEEGRTSKSATSVSSSKVVSGSSASRLASSDIAATSRSSNSTCRNGPVVSQREMSKTDFVTSVETSSRSTSQLSSKSVHSSTSRVEPLRDTSQRHASRSGHQSLNHSSSQPKSANSQPPDLWPEAKAKSRFESTSESKSEPKSEPKSESKSDRSSSAKSHLLDGRSASASSVVNLASEKSVLPTRTAALTVAVVAEPSDTDFAGSLENSNLQRLSKKASKNRDRPKSSSQFCKDREFDADKHCGVLCADTGKPCTHSLTCKIHALSLRRAVSPRTKPFDQLLSEHRALKDALLRKKLELQKSRTDFDVASPPSAAVPTAVPTSCVSSPVRPQTQRPPPADTGTAQVAEHAAEPCPLPPTPVLVRSPRPRPKPRFRSPVFRSSCFFSVLAPATGVDEKQIARPTKLPVFANESAIRLQDSDSAVLPRGAEDREAISRVQSSSYLLHHPKPIAMNRFGAWKSGPGCAVFSRREDLCRAMVEDMVDSHLRPPPHKKLCVEASLSVNISESFGPPSMCDPYHFTTGDVHPPHAAAAPSVSSSSTTAFLSPSRKQPPSKSKSRSSHFSPTSHELSTFSNSGRLSTDSNSAYRLYPRDSETDSASQRNSTTANHRRLSSTSDDAAPPSAEKYTADFAANNKFRTFERGGNSSLGGSESNPRLPNGQHPQAISQSGKRRSQVDGVQYIDDAGHNKQQKKVEDGAKAAGDAWRVRSEDTAKADDSRFKDWQGVRRMSAYETTRPSVIAFGSQASQKSTENSCHLTSSSLSNLNGLQQGYRSSNLQTLNHKPPHLSSLVSRDRHVGSQSSMPSSAPGLKSATQVNRTLGIPMT